ncbi:MAG: tRNA lysidine(34) synthetase TilS [Lachnospiraceae bacterium]|nr:tRNA lysidine(34) synthetase TilS [Lachnospiraceae bacterium]
MLGKIRDFIEKYDMLAEGDVVVLGISGGADSVALLLIMKELEAHFGVKLHAVHVNHGLRGEDSDRDEAFTKALCERLGVPFEVYREDVAAVSDREGLSLEEAGRKVRYAAFEAAAAKIHANRIAVAHHMDDNAETVIFRIARGTGLKGLAGMHPKRELTEGITLIRPMLSVSRGEIEAWLESRHQAYCTDLTNFEDEYSRNAIRNRVLPSLEDINSGASENICALAEAAAAADEYLGRAAEEKYGRLVEFGRTGETMLVRIPKDPEPVLFERILRNTLFKVAKHEKDITSTHIRLIAELAQKQTGSRLSLPYGVTAEKSYDCIVFKREADKAASHLPKLEEVVIPMSGLEDGPVTAEFPGFGTFEFELFNGKCSSFSKEDYTKFFDYDKITCNPVLRTPREGDSVVISPEGGRKPLKKLFSDLKISKEDREAIPVIAEGSNVLWIPGIRTGENRRVDNNTGRILKIHWRK